MLELSGDGSDFALEVIEFQTAADGRTQPVFVRVLAWDADSLARLRASLGIESGQLNFDTLSGGGGFLDMDSDGDLDIVFSYNDAGQDQRGWFENTAGGADAISFDLDGDGSVNTADLSLLLLNFSE